MVRVLISDPIDQEGLKPLKENKGFEITEAHETNGLDHFEAWLVRSETKVTRDKIDKAKRLKLIGRAGTGVDNIDVEEATRRGILVVNVPGANAIAVAEHVLGLMLGVMRRLSAADRAVKGGGWRDKSLMGSELYGKKLGLLGLGRVGKEVAKRASAFGMEVLAHDPFISAQSASELGVKAVGFEELLSQADVLSVHVPLTATTKGLVGGKTLSLMKTGAILINTSRGEVVDEAALAQAINEGQIASAALDVFEKEPPKGSPLLALGDKVLLAPHIGATTREAQRRVARELAQSVMDFFERGLVRGGVNLPPEFEPEILDRLNYHLSLAERLGKFLGQFLPGAWNRIRLNTAKRFSEKDARVLLHGALRGILSCALGDTVNVVNAAFYAKERNIQIRTEELPGSSELEDIALSLRTADERSASISGRVDIGGELRISRIGDLVVDVIPQGALITIENQDKPGMIGKVGTLLGGRRINIADMRVGRKSKGKDAIMVLTIDNTIPKSLLEALGRMDGVTRVAQINL
ncbi:MAG: phosphoglycerate dehydrogenase [Elusimicrobia bacterium]|nr:phosphoglycerate dehydrogenase [Elusimicrobiota bacterium]